MPALYPATVATQADLKVAANQVQSQLAIAMGAADTVLTVQNGSRFAANMLLSIDQEILWASAVSGNQITIAQRGFDGTVAASHAASAMVSVLIDAWHHNQPASEIIAIETFLGPNGQNLTGATAVSARFIFPPQSPGGSLTPGNNVITLTPVPQGVNGTDQNHWVYISGGTGTAEPVLITGGTAVAGAASGTVIVNCANAHSGAWTIATATSGIAEAIQSLITGGVGGLVSVPAGLWNMYAGCVIPWKVIVQGVDRHASILLNQATTTGVFALNAPYIANDFTRSMGVSNLSIFGSAVGHTTVDVQADAIYGYGGGNMTLITDVTVKNHNIGIHLAGGTYNVIERFEVSLYGDAGVYLQYGDGMFICTGVISNNALTGGSKTGSSGLLIDNSNGPYIRDVDITRAFYGVRIRPSSGNSCNYGFFTNVLADTCLSHGWYFDTSLGGGIASIQCVDCWASFSGNNLDSTWNTGRGIMISGTAAGNPTGVSFIGGRARLSGGNGVDIIGGSYIKIVGMEINGNGINTMNGFSGVSLDNTTSHVVIADNQIGNWGVGPTAQTQAYAVIMVGSGSDFIMIEGNDLSVNNTAPLDILNPFPATATVNIQNNLSIDGQWLNANAAATFALVNACNRYHMFANVPIATITGGWKGRRVVFVFGDPAPGGFVTGGNIGKAMSVTTNQKVTGEFDGTTWYFS